MKTVTLHQARQWRHHQTGEIRHGLMNTPGNPDDWALEKSGRWTIQTEDGATGCYGLSQYQHRHGRHDRQSVLDWLADGQRLYQLA